MYFHNWFFQHYRYVVQYMLMFGRKGSEPPETQGSPFAMDNTQKIFESICAYLNLHVTASNLAIYNSIFKTGSY